MLKEGEILQVSPFVTKSQVSTLHPDIYQIQVTQWQPFELVASSRTMVNDIIIQIQTKRTNGQRGTSKVLIF